MLTYTYLKENPVERDKVIKEGWAQLFTDPAVAFGIKEQLRELLTISATPSDALLYWHEVYKMDEFFGHNLSDRKDEVFKSHWIDDLYNIIQRYPIYENKCKRLFYMLHDRILDIVLTKEELLRGLDHMYNTTTIWIFILRCLTIDEVHSDERAKEVLSRCDINWIRRRPNIQGVYDYLRDTPEQDTKFKSFKELQCVHDEHAEKEAQERLKDVSDFELRYDDKFQEIVHSHGFWLPSSDKEIAKRGLQHHHCLATYIGRHKSGSKDVRIILSKEGSVELNFDISEEHDLIIGANVNQYRGLHNKVLCIPKDLLLICCELVGQAPEILDVWERVGGER